MVMVICLFFAPSSRSRDPPKTGNRNHENYRRWLRCSPATFLIHDHLHPRMYVLEAFHLKPTEEIYRSLNISENVTLSITKIPEFFRIFQWHIYRFFCSQIADFEVFSFSKSFWSEIPVKREHVSKKTVGIKKLRNLLGNRRDTLV